MIYLALFLFIAFSYWLPWWGVIGVGLGFGYMSQSWRQALGVSFISYFIFWSTLCYTLDLQSYGLMGDRLTQFLSLSSPLYLYSITGLLGGLLCFAGAQLGYSLKLWQRQRSQNYLRKNARKS